MAEWAGTSGPIAGGSGANVPLPRSTAQGSDVGRALAAATRVALSFELNMVALVELVEDGFFDARRVKEQFLAACVPNEAVASITNDSRDRTGFRHAAPSLLLRSGQSVQSLL